LTTAPRIKPTSIFLRSARRPNPGRRSTYRRGIIVRTTGTGSDCVTGIIVDVGDGTSQVMWKGFAEPQTWQNANLEPYWD
jgi:hypothetical protein